ncbi:hypothetical protein [Kitasatospora kifunensis]|uniref:Gram-positive cocci surface proteins LPxTG domain-containing protein n=1 Tax=Kitasatospora kifunensis TaxID=58351 RepID=A0A7W7VTF3_KITKI|nr:hypothetical protein [Kitasatospora kifunensis]MBB4921688.1 hypothetical protein [Kitasatospora kifunensis]
MHHPLRRTLPALAALGIAVTAPLLAAGPAQAHDGARCDDAGISYSTDGGSSWITSGGLSGTTGTVQVKLDGTAGKGCSYQVSLASYSTQGGSWASSGTQTFLGWATATLTRDKSQATLDISAHLPQCYGQIDLYSGSVKHDGVSAPAPHYPTGVYGGDLISAWNGGAPCQSPAPTPTPSASVPVLPTPSAGASLPGTPLPSQSATGSPSPSAAVPSASASAPATVAPSASASRSASASASASATKPSASATALASGSASASAVAVASPSSPAPTGSAAATGEPVGTPSVKPVSATPTGLAFTGTNGTQLTAFAGGGAALLVVGAGAVFFARRRSSAQR